MTSRRVGTLLIAAFLVVAFAIWMSSTRHLQRDTAAGSLVLPGLEAALNSISQVQLKKGDGSRTTLNKGTAQWTVAERGYPADSGKVRKLLLDLASLNIVEEKTRTPANFPQLGVEDVNSPKAGGTQVDAVTPGKTYSLIVGKSSSAQSGYVRVTGSPQSLLAAPATALDADPRHWLDPSVIDIAQERVKDFTIRPADGPGYTASRSRQDQPDFKVENLPKGRELSNPTAADPTAGALAGLTLEDLQPVPSPAPDPKTLAHATFHTFDGLQIDLSGRKDGSRALIAVSADAGDKAAQAQAQAINARAQGVEFQIAGYRYDGLFRSLEDLLKKPPEPARKNSGSTARKKTAKP